MGLTARRAARPRAVPARGRRLDDMVSGVRHERRRAQAVGARRAQADGPASPRVDGRGSSAASVRRPAPTPAAEPDRTRRVHVPTGCGCRRCSPQAGVGSRRACEELIAAGRVAGRRPGGARARRARRPDAARPSTSTASACGSTRPVYLAFNKPAGVVSTMSDTAAGRRSPTSSATATERLFHVGRLDSDTEGLILLTNDGELAHRLQHPSLRRPEDLPRRDRGPGRPRPGPAAARRASS